MQEVIMSAHTVDLITPECFTVRVIRNVSLGKERNLSQCVRIIRTLFRINHKASETCQHESMKDIEITLH